MNTKMKWSLGWLVVLVGASNYIQAQQGAIEMKDAINVALTNNYSLKADSMNLWSADYRKVIRLADAKTQVTYTSKTEYNPSIASQMVPGSFLGQPGKESVPVKFGTRYSMGSSLEASQTIFNKALRYQVATAELDQQVAHTRHLLTREDLVYNVAYSYYSLQTSAEKIRLTSNDYDNLAEIVRIAKAQFENGVLKRIDYESLQINAANKQSELNQLQSKYDEQLTYFKYLLGVDPSTEIRVTQNVRGITATQESDLSVLYNRQDIRLYDQLLGSKEMELKGIRAERKPITQAYFRFNYQAQFDQLKNAMKNDYWFHSSTVGISTRFTLFDGNRRRSRVSLAQAELQQLKFRTEQQHQLAKTEWLSATETLQKDRKNFKIAEQNLDLAERVFLSRKALYAEGMTTLIELLDAEKELTQSRNLHIQAMINVQTSVLNLHKASGTLMTEFLNNL